MKLVEKDQKGHDTMITLVIFKAYTKKAPTNDR